MTRRALMRLDELGVDYEFLDVRQTPQPPNG
jgi:hypothetical protein